MKRKPLTDDELKQVLDVACRAIAKSIVEVHAHTLLRQGIISVGTFNAMLTMPDYGRQIRQEETR